MSETNFDFSVLETIPDTDAEIEVPEEVLEGPKTEEEQGVANLILDAISNSANTIQMYNAIIANCTDEEIVDSLNEILVDENRIMGKLQSILQKVSPNAEEIMNGAIEDSGLEESFEGRTNLYGLTHIIVGILNDSNELSDCDINSVGESFRITVNGIRYEYVPRKLSKIEDSGIDESLDESYKLRFYCKQEGPNQGDLDHEEFFDTRLEAINRYEEVFDRNAYSLNPTMWISNGDGWKRLSEPEIPEINESLNEGVNSRKVYVVEPHKIDMDLYDIVFIDNGKRASSKRFESYEDAVKFIKRTARYNNWIAGNIDDSLEEGYTKQELINAVQSAYGYSKKEAKDYIKTIDDKTKEELIKGFKRDAKKSFLTDSLKENVYKEWKPNTSFKHIKSVLDTALARGKYINNERDEVFAALDKADKGGYTPEQRKFIKDKHREMWKKNRTVESFIIDESNNLDTALDDITPVRDEHNERAIRDHKKYKEDRKKAFKEISKNAKDAFELDESLFESFYLNYEDSDLLQDWDYGGLDFSVDIHPYKYEFYTSRDANKALKIAISHGYKDSWREGHYVYLTSH